jgi:cytochrome c6
MKYRVVLAWIVALLFVCALNFEAIAAPDLTSTPLSTPTSTPASASPVAPDLIQGSQVFEAQCAGCHVGGGNIIRRGKNLKLKTLQKNKVDTIAAISALVTAGKGNMSAYGDRLSPVEIEAVSAYVLDQAASNWK